MKKGALAFLISIFALQIGMLHAAIPGIPWKPNQVVDKKDFFQLLMGKHEAAWVDENLLKTGKKPGDVEVQKVIREALRKRDFAPGKFESMSIQELVDATKHIKKNGVGANFRIICSDKPDATIAIDSLQADNADACFLIASRFHALEKNANREWYLGKGNGPEMQELKKRASHLDVFLDKENEKKWRGYGNFPSFMEAFYVGTQGETAALSAAIATIWRMYGVAPVQYADGREDNVPFDQVKDLGIKLDPVGTFSYAENKDAIDKIIVQSERLEAIEASELLKKVNIGIHTDAEVSYRLDPSTASSVDQNGKLKCVMPGKKIMQVFVSAINLNGNAFEGLTLEKKEKLAKFFLYAAFKGTLLAAAAKGKEKVFLTLIGGLAFKNEFSWIVECVKAMNDFIWDLGLDVTMNCFIEKQDSIVCKELASFTIVKPSLNPGMAGGKKIDAMGLKIFLKGKPFATRTAFYEYPNVQNTQCLFSVVEGNLQDQKFQDDSKGLLITDNIKINKDIFTTVDAGLAQAGKDGKEFVAVSMKASDADVLDACEKWLAANPNTSIKEVRFVKQNGVSTKNQKPFFDNALGNFKKFVVDSNLSSSQLITVQTNLKNLAVSMKGLKDKLALFSKRLKELQDKLAAMKGARSTGSSKSVKIAVVNNSVNGVVGQKFEENGKYAAIVNAAKESMLGGGLVDGAIHLAAGETLKTECLLAPEIGGKDVRCPTGQAKLVLGHNLSPLRIINAVGPIGAGHAQLLKDAYRNTLVCADVLKLAARNTNGSLKEEELLSIKGVTKQQLTEAETVPIKTVAFSLVGLGFFQAMAIGDGAIAIFETIKDYFETHKKSNIEEIRLVTYKAEEYDAFKAALRTVAGLQEVPQNLTVWQWLNSSSSDPINKPPLCYQFIIK